MAGNRPPDSVPPEPVPLDPVPLDTVPLFGFPIACADLAGVAEHLLLLAGTDRVSYVVTMNVDHVVELSENERFRRAYDGATVRVADGTPVVLVARLAGRRLPGRVTGADLLPVLCQGATERGLGVAVIGGAEDVNALAVEQLRQTYPGLAVSGFSPFGFDEDETVSLDIVERLRELQARIVFVCFGAPRSEIWVSEHAALLPPAVYVCAGAGVDFAAGTRRRAPRWMQSAGLEWLYRLVQEPGRLWRRYLVRDMAFVPIAGRELVAAFRRRR